MPLTVVLAVGLDSSESIAQSSPWKSAGFVVVSAYSVAEAFDRFQAGDFDLVLLGHSISIESRKRLTSLIRASGSRTPVVCIAKSSTDSYSFADATLKNDSSQILTGIGELLAKRARIPAAQAMLYGNPN
jgi:DNA-binding NarL/FixJ family response regulator